MILPLLRLRRIEFNPDETIGLLSIQDEKPERIICFILELPWKENRRDVSCIPNGLYILRKFFEPSVNIGLWSCTYEVTHVPNRTGILFHIGNIEEDTTGCLLPGERVGEVYGHRGVNHSAIAFDTFMEEMKGITTAHLLIG